MIFKITRATIFSYLIVPLFNLILFLALLYYLSPGLSLSLELLFLFFFFLIAGITIVPAIILLINHYKYFKTTTFEYNDFQKEFCLTNNLESIKFKKSEIISIIRYNARTGSIPWREVYIWEIQTKNKLITLAPIIISKNDFNKIFAGIDIQYKHEPFDGSLVSQTNILI